jgi:hypothetical protein
VGAAGGGWSLEVFDDELEEWVEVDTWPAERAGAARRAFAAAELGDQAARLEGPGRRCYYPGPNETNRNDFGRVA